MTALRRSPLSVALATATVALFAVVLATSPARGQYSEDFGKNKIQYRRFDWQVYHSPHFDLYYYPEETVLLEKVVSLAESAYDRLSREFDYQIKEPTPLIFFATHSAFEQNNIYDGFVPEGVGAFASPVRNRMVLPVDVPDPELQALIGHELTHIFQYHILFQGKLSRALTSNPPGWLMEGMASYMGQDERPRDRMFLRDLVINDAVPGLASNRFGSDFLAYRFGHAVFDFIEQRWGREGFRDFLFEYRNTIGSKIDKAVKKAFRMEPDDFDTEFRRWLRKKYLPEFVATGEPSDFGRRFRAGEEFNPAHQISPAASPSGDLLAAFSTVKGDVDVVLFDTNKRTVVRSLTKGSTHEYISLVAQEFTGGRKMGRDLAFSPDGNTVAVFAKRERGRSLLLLDVLKGGIRRKIELGTTEQQLSPAFSPDGKRIAFSAANAGRFDIYELELESGKITNLTDDEAYDGSPVYMPDGKWLVYSSVVGDKAKLFRMDLANPTVRFQITSGDSEEHDAVPSPDGKRLYYTSDRGGIENIYGLDLTSGEVRQYTKVITGCYMPTVLPRPEGGERLVYSGYWKGHFDLYTIDSMEVTAVDKIELPQTPAKLTTLAHFEPDIRVTVDEANKEKYHSFKLFLENGGASIGVNSDQTFVADTYLSFTDYLGNRRVTAIFSSIESFSNFDIEYMNLAHRTQWGARVFDDRTFFISQDAITGRVVRDQAAIVQTGAEVFSVYPFDVYHRVEVGGGFIFRKLDFQSFVLNPADGTETPTVLPRNDNFPLIEGALVGDTTIFAEFGPLAGRRWRLSGSWSPDLGKKEALPGIRPGSTLTANVELDARQYLQVTRRSTLAMRLFVGASFGNAPQPFYFGGLDTLRGFDFREVVGNRAAFANLEYRFPILDVVQGPVLNLRGIRGRVFLDVGGAYFTYSGQDFKFYDSTTSQLQDGRAAYGWGFTIDLAGLDLNWDFAKQWRFPGAQPGFQTSFWIGTQF